MSIRLQILVPEALARRIRATARRRQLSTSAWARQAMERMLDDDRPTVDPLAKLCSLGAPTADIGQMLAEIRAGRG